VLPDYAHVLRSSVDCAVEVCQEPSIRYAMIHNLVSLFGFLAVKASLPFLFETSVHDAQYFLHIKILNGSLLFLTVF
jgi:hypothetical protein